MKPRAAPPEKILFVQRLLDWFARAMRPLPWRAAYDPYSVWISEIMLQQTQMDRGVEYFNAWMRRFPDVRSVATADEREILAAWEGLGYYSRARNLQAAAKRIVAEYGGAFPDSADAIRSLPGVGDYTAGAIASIAFNLPEPAVDANVLRIFCRILDIASPPTDRAVKNRITEAVRSLMPEESPRLFNQALMELGALVCGKTPRCDACPVPDHCAARKNGTAAERPARKEKKEYRKLETTAAIIVRDGRVLIRRRPDAGLWAGMWEFPGGETIRDESPERAVVRGVLEETGLAVETTEKIAVVRHGYTVWRVTLHGFLCRVVGDESVATPEETKWVLPGECADYPFPAGHRKLLEILGWKKSAKHETSSDRPPRAQ